jgi:hypothetical protein
MGLLDKLIKPGPPSQDEFAKAVLDGIKRAGEKRPVFYDKDRFAIRTPEKNGALMNLGNAYPELCGAPKSARPGVVQKWIRMWLATCTEMPDDFEDARPDLLPTVQARSHYELVQLQFEVEGRKGAARPYEIVGEHFAVGLVYDLPESMKHVTHAALDGWGVTLYEALETARHNLAQLPFAFVGPGEGEGLWACMAKDSYDSARILLPDVLRGFRVRGDIVAMIPNRETLLVAGADDLGSLKGMLTLAKETLQQPRRISGIALRLDGDEWTPWLPEESHPLYWDFRRLHTQSFGQAYSEQKELLDKLHEKTGEDVFVASFLGMEREGTNELSSYCVWGNGVLAWLPRTDLVVCAETKGQTPRMVPWERVVEVVGDLMKPMGMYPERWQVSEFPSAEQLKAMRGNS